MKIITLICHLKYHNSYWILIYENQTHANLRDACFGYYLCMYVASNIGMTSLTGLMSDVYEPAPFATKVLQHYLFGNGESIEIDNFGFAIAGARTARYYYYNHMNKYMDMIEKLAVLEYTYCMQSTPNTIWGIQYYNPTENAVEGDWYLTIGGGDVGIVSEVSCIYNNDGQKIYTAKVKYYILDYYDWESEGTQRNLYLLHVCGFAQDFFIHGEYETIIEWNEGSRFPICSTPYEVNLEQLQFDGVVDKNLYETYKKCNDFYKNYTN